MWGNVGDLLLRGCKLGLLRGKTTEGLEARGKDYWIEGNVKETGKERSESVAPDPQRLCWEVSQVGKTKTSQRKVFLIERMGGTSPGAHVEAFSGRRGRVRVRKKREETSQGLPSNQQDHHPLYL